MAERLKERVAIVVGAGCPPGGLSATAAPPPSSSLARGRRSCWWIATATPPRRPSAQSTPRAASPRAGAAYPLLAYSTSEGGVNALTRSMAMQYAAKGSA